MRYVGQEHTLTVDIPGDSGRIEVDVDDLREQFRSDYDRTFGLQLDDPIEIVSIRATVRTPLPRRGEAPTGASSNGAGKDATPVGVTRAYSFARRDWADFDVIVREDLDVGTAVQGPAILLEQTATSYVDAGFAGHVDESGTIIFKATEA
jgi:N-methylhydantoinase A